MPVDPPDEEADRWAAVDPELYRLYHQKKQKLENQRKDERIQFIAASYGNEWQPGWIEGMDGSTVLDDWVRWLDYVPLGEF